MFRMHKKLNINRTPVSHTQTHTHTCAFTREPTSDVITRLIHRLAVARAQQHTKRNDTWPHVCSTKSDQKIPSVRWKVISISYISTRFSGLQAKLHSVWTFMIACRPCRCWKSNTIDLKHIVSAHNESVWTGSWGKHQIQSWGKIANSRLQWQTIALDVRELSGNLTWQCNKKI